MTMRRTHVVALAVAVAVLLGGAKCGSNEGPTSRTTKKPTGDQAIVDSRTELKNMPGGEGRDHVLIRICVSNGGCDTFSPPKVKYCYPGDNWPQCKSD